MNILVTGGAGFIGSHIVDKLSEKGNEVTVIDNLSTGKKGNIDSNLKFYEEDVKNCDIKTMLKKEKFDVIYHLAAQIDGRKSIKAPLYDAENNINGSINIFELAKKMGTQKIIYSSTAAVYGSPSPANLPLGEKSPTQPRVPYGISKLSAENYLQFYSQQHDIDCIILRFSNVYGPRQKYSGEGSVVVAFIKRMLQGKHPIIHGDGKQTRDFIYVNDVAEACVKALNYNRTDILNVSTGTETSIIKLYSILRSLAGFELEPIYKGKRSGDISRSVLNNSKICNKMNWQPSTSLKTGLEKTIKYYQKKFN